MPKSRYRNKKSQYDELLNMKRLAMQLGQEYVIAIYHDEDYEKRNARNQEKIHGFSYDVTGKVDIRTMMMAADVIIGDYCNIFFEAAFLQKPIFLTAKDISTYEKNTPSLIPYEDLRMGPTVKDADELAKLISNLDAYDFSPAESFREKYFNLCDGHSAQRLLKHMTQL